MLLGISFDMKTIKLLRNQLTLPAVAIWSFMEEEKKLSSTQIIFKLLERAMKLISDAPTSSPS